jgi:hypothetical protein
MDAWRELQKHALMCTWIGISTDEAQRMKPSREPWLTSIWPLVSAVVFQAWYFFL